LKKRKEPRELLVPLSFLPITNFYWLLADQREFAVGSGILQIVMERGTKF
jgi:hypothetical protein